MCIFCAAIPVAAATGARLNAKQLEARRKAMENASESAANALAPEPNEIPAKPIMRITGGVIVLLLIGSVTYHTLAYR